MRQIHVLIDLQYGSTGKGALAAMLGAYLKPGLAIAAWGPNAGHTSYGLDDTRYVHTMIPNSTTMGVPFALIGPGAVINVEAMRLELEAPALKDLTVVIHPSAMVVRERHRQEEQELVRVGSTMKGTSAAMIEKIRRDSEVSPLAGDSTELWGLMEELRGPGKPSILMGEDEYQHAFGVADVGLLEGAQGFSLGIHNARFWPYVTSRDVSPYQMLADCRVPVLRQRPIIWGVARTYPIRVANRYADVPGNWDTVERKMVGTSGGHYPDQIELQWESIRREPELTTVTKLPRRLFSFSDKQIRDACRVANPDVVMLSFCDYVEPRPSPGDRIGRRLYNIVAAINEASDRGDVVKFLSFGPRISDVMIYDDGCVKELARPAFHLIMLRILAGAR